MPNPNQPQQRPNQQRPEQRPKQPGQDARDPGRREGQQQRPNDNNPRR